MKLVYLIFLVIIFGGPSYGQSSKSVPAATGDKVKFAKGTFGYDRKFLSAHDSILVLADGDMRVMVSPKYQGKVFTSSAEGDVGKSFGWINYKAFDGKPDEHMNAFGGEDRLWLGPEGGPFSVFFKPNTKMEFANWHTPPAMDSEPWKLDYAGRREILMTKKVEIVNYANTVFKIKLSRRVQIMQAGAIANILGYNTKFNIKAVGFLTKNTIFNDGDKPWDKTTGAPCLWNLDMFTPSEKTVIVIPYKEGITGNIATTDYFGQIPADRVKYINGVLLFRADGRLRGKLGMPPNRATGKAGSYDAKNNVLTITLFDVDSTATYLNQEWRTDKPPFFGDAVNAYNDGPLATGGQMGPFYEIESVSPAAFLQPGQWLTHIHTVIHFTGKKSALNAIAIKTLGISLNNIQAAFK